MKKLVLAALFVGGLTQATGCIIVSDDDDDVDSSTFLVSWTLESELAASPGPVTCQEAGATTIRTISQPTGGADIVDLFDCVDGQHETAPLPLGDYLVWTEALDSGDFLIAQSNSTEETLFDANPVGVDFVYPYDVGFFGLTWTLTEDTSPPTALTCDDVGANAVSVLVTPVGDAGSAADELFNCADGSGTTFPWGIADFTLSVDLIHDNGTPQDPGDDTVLSNEPATFSESLEFGNQLVDLGNIDFAFAPE